MDMNIPSVLCILASSFSCKVGLPYPRDNAALLNWSQPPCPRQNSAIYINEQFLLRINEQPGQGTLAKKATKWESHQYEWTLHSESVNDAGWKKFFAWGEHLESLWCLLASWPH